MFKILAYWSVTILIRHVVHYLVSMQKAANNKHSGYIKFCDQLKLFANSSNTVTKFHHIIILPRGGGVERVIKFYNTLVLFIELASLFANNTFLGYLPCIRSVSKNILAHSSCLVTLPEWRLFLTSYVIYLLQLSSINLSLTVIS